MILPRPTRLIQRAGRFVFGPDTAPRATTDAADPAVPGRQCQLWTEGAPRAEDVEYLAFPRLCALADALWSARPDWTAFAPRWRCTNTGWRRCPSATGP